MLSSNSGIDVISLLFSSTVSPARQMDCSLTHAESMWVNELEDFDPRIHLPSIETCFPLRSSISVFPKTDKHAPKAFGSIREITLSKVSTLGQPLGSSTKGLRSSTEFIHRDVIITTAEIGGYGNNDYITHFMLTTSFHPWIEC